jgi:translation initiation factor IF-2
MRPGIRRPRRPHETRPEAARSGLSKGGFVRAMASHEPGWDRADAAGSGGRRRIGRAAAGSGGPPPDRRAAGKARGLGPSGPSQCRTSVLLWPSDGSPRRPHRRPRGPPGALGIGRAAAGDGGLRGAGGRPAPGGGRGGPRTRSRPPRRDPRTRSRPPGPRAVAGRHGADADPPPAPRGAGTGRRPGDPHGLPGARCPARGRRPAAGRHGRAARRRVERSDDARAAGGRRGPGRRSHRCLGRPPPEPRPRRGRRAWGEPGVARRPRSSLARRGAGDGRCPPPGPGG